MMPLNELIEAQAAWARKRWPRHSGARAPSLDANLMVRMTATVRCQFERGSGGELGAPGRPGKMSSLRSSSALSYNVFAPWIGHDLDGLASVLGVTLVDRALEFERQFHHGLDSTPPNLDVVLDIHQPRPLALESKFTELYGKKKLHAPLDDKYFVGGRHRWAECGLPRCQALAQGIGKATEFRRLGAGQLLKHILGLGWTTRAAPRLLYVYYDAGREEASEHERELERFQGLIDTTLDFRAVTYQHVFGELRRVSEPRRGYNVYLASRYGAE